SDLGRCDWYFSDFCANLYTSFNVREQRRKSVRGKRDIPFQKSKGGLLMGKRIFLFLSVNALIVITIMLVTNILGIRHYVTEQGIDFSALLVFSAIVGFTGALISLALSRVMAKWVMGDRKSKRLNSSPVKMSYAVFCLARKRRAMAPLSPQ